MSRRAKDHIREELRKLDAKLGEHECPLKTTPRCPELVVGLQDLKFHLQDVHGVDAFNGPKRARRADDAETSSKRPRSDKTANGTQLIDKTDDLSVSSYFFAIVEAKAHPTLDSSRDTVTPPSSPCSDIFDKIDPRLFNELSHPNLSIETLDLVDVTRSLNC